MSKKYSISENNDYRLIFNEDIIKRAHNRTLKQFEQKKISELYLKEFGREILTTCPNRFRDALNALYYKNINKKTRVMEKKSEARKYHLKRGFSIIYKGTTYTQMSLTDSVAKAFLELNPEKRAKFSKIPESHVFIGEDIVEKKLFESENEEFITKIKKLEEQIEYLKIENELLNETIKSYKEQDAGNITSDDIVEKKNEDDQERNTIVDE